MRKFLAFIGFLLLIIGTYSPLLHPPLLNWNVYTLNKPYGVAILVVAAAGLASIVAGSHKLSRALAWASLLLIVLLYLAAVMKVNMAFSFIPFKMITRFLTHLIKFKWGWYLLFGGAILAVLGNSGKSKKPAYKKAR